jgi:hypothetical protein
MQGRSSPEAQDVQERGLLMFEHVQRIMDQMKNNSDILNMARLPKDNPDESQIGPSGPKLIDVDEITGLDDPEFTTLSVELPTGVLAQLETIGVSYYQWKQVHQTPSVS